MKVGAYLLAADPAWLEASVGSYYHMVDRIVVSYDQDARSWTGAPLDIQSCLDRLGGIDPDGKLDFQPGAFSHPGTPAMQCETAQRQHAFDSFDGSFDWVLQLDTDEVVCDAETLADCLGEADRRGFSGLDYPARNLYQHAGGARFLERSRRFWQVAAAYPGVVAARPGAQLRLGRQCDVNTFRVDFSWHNTDPAHARDAPVHRVIRPAQGINHYSWLRGADQMRAKARTSGHAGDLDWNAEIDKWEWRRDHPVLAATGTPLRRAERWNSVHWLRLATIDTPPCPDLDALVGA